VAPVRPADDPRLAGERIARAPAAGPGRIAAAPAGFGNAARLRLCLGTVALAIASGLLAADLPHRGAVVLDGLGLLALGAALARRRLAAATAGIMLLATGYATTLAGGFDLSAPVRASGLLLVAEIACWSIEMAPTGVVEHGLASRQAARTVFLAIAAACVAAAVLAVASSPTDGSPGVQAAGIAAAGAAVTLAAGIRREHPG
jgi:hypothetical protein